MKTKEMTREAEAKDNFAAPFSHVFDEIRRQENQMAGLSIKLNFAYFIKSLKTILLYELFHLGLHYLK